MVYNFEDERGPSDEFECKEAQRLRDQRQNDRIVALEREIIDLKYNVSFLLKLEKVNNQIFEKLDKRIKELEK